MAGFEFRKSTVTMELNGVKFEVDPIVCDRHRAEFAEKSQELLNVMVQSGYSEESVRAYIEEAVKTLDLILGEGAVSKIYGSRPVDYVSICDLMAYISQETASFYTRRTNSYSGNLNREQRRKLEHKKK